MDPKLIEILEDGQAWMNKCTELDIPAAIIFLNKEHHEFVLTLNLPSTQHAQFMKGAAEAVSNNPHTIVTNPLSH